MRRPGIYPLKEIYTPTRRAARLRWRAGFAAQKT